MSNVEEALLPRHSVQDMHERRICAIVERILRADETGRSVHLVVNRLVPFQGQDRCPGGSSWAGTTADDGMLEPTI